MKTRNFQEVYDFCRLDATYRAYHDLPGWAHEYPSRKKYDYYHRAFSPNNLSRAGNYMYFQAEKQLLRFLSRKDLEGLFVRVGRFEDGFQEVDIKTYNNLLWRSFLVFARIDKDGVVIRFEHPFDRNKECIRFVARSHRPFTKEGIFAEAMAYIDKHILLPPGRYRDLQLWAGKTKEDFVKWYKIYRENQKYKADEEHQAMLDRYRKKREPMSYNECYALMAGLGLFEELGADRYERHELASEFCEIMNR